MGVEFHTTTAGSSRLDRWHPDDFVRPSTPQTTPVDPWHPAEVHVPAIEIAANAEPDDWWNPVSAAPAGLLLDLEPVDRWFEEVDCPSFDPNARREEWHLESLDGPFVRDARSKANWIVAILQPVSPSKREKWLRIFEQVFLEFREERFFRTIRELASEVDSPDPLLGAIELKRIWEDRADFRQVRIPLRQRGVIYRDCGTLSWPMALQIALARPDYEPLEMIDSDWIDDWRRLRSSCEGYWSFADYALMRAESEQFEDWDAAARPYREERVWSTGRSTPASDVSEMSVRIREGHPSVPRELAARFEAWRDEQSHLQKPIPDKAEPNFSGSSTASLPPIPSAPVASVQPQLVAKPYDSVFNELKREMLETIKLANETRDRAIIHEGR